MNGFIVEKNAVVVYVASKASPWATDWLGCYRSVCPHSKLIYGGTAGVCVRQLSVEGFFSTMKTIHVPLLVKLQAIIRKENFDPGWLVDVGPHHPSGRGVSGFQPRCKASLS